MRMLIAAVAAAILFVGAGSTAWADAGVQPVGSVPIPDGPAQTWLVADLDSGQVLAARDENLRHPPASTIKVLLALVALDELSLESAVVADTADTQVECNCVGVQAGHSYRQRRGQHAGAHAGRTGRDRGENGRESRVARRAEYARLDSVGVGRARRIRLVDGP
jgi:D-alanyl-D-alanine carboxypeptidase